MSVKKFAFEILVWIQSEKKQIKKKMMKKIRKRSKKYKKHW